MYICHSHEMMKDLRTEPRIVSNPFGGLHMALQSVPFKSLPLRSDSVVASVIDSARVLRPPRRVLATLCASVIACSFNASVAAGFDLAVRDASCLVCHRRFGGEDNSWDMVALPRRSECAL